MTLYAKNPGGAYRVATPKDMLTAARHRVGRLFARGHAVPRPADSRECFQMKLAGLDSECFAVLFLDNRHRLLAYEELFTGTLDTCRIHPRLVAQRALYHNAAAVIFGHHHPSGSPTPSLADARITQPLKDALGYLDVRGLEHLIVGDTVLSLVERGLL
jgi:DNA repair protein RadC